jgi:hypothetical protein
MDTSTKTSLGTARHIIFDFDGARKIDSVIGNLSGVAVDGPVAWTVSDEGRTFERHERTATGFRLSKQYDLDDFFPGLPGGKEADLESLAVSGDRIWLCGSHCRVRLQPNESGALSSGVRRRRSRHLLGSIRLDANREPIRGSAAAMPFFGAGSLRSKLSPDPFLFIFLDLPSKENGLDIEGLAVLPKMLLLGLRGPVIDNHALVLSLPRDNELPTTGAEPYRHLLDLSGLGVRDLCGGAEEVLILAGPVTSADGPFRVYSWQPFRSGLTETAYVLHEWPIDHEHPEGICRLDLDGRPGLLIVYDGADDRRRDGATVTGDWFAVPAFDG